MTTTDEMRARQVQLVRYPDGRVRPQDFRVVEAPLPAPAENEVLVRNTWCSVDPGMRLQMRPAGPAGYFPAFPLHGPMGGMAVGEVVESRCADFAPGDVVVHALGWRDYAVVGASGDALGGIGTLRRVDTGLAPPQAYLGVLGGPGLTAYAGLLHVAGLRPGDVVWVSAAAGAVGSLAAQIAKLKGHRVIGSAGSDEKVAALLDEVGLDAAFNHRAGPVGDQLRRAAPEGIDVYFDNVGGEHLEAALDSLRRWGRVAICGAVSEYERSGPATGVRNLFQAVANDLTLRGFRGSSHVEHRPAFERDVAGWLREGRIRYRETVVEGLEHAPDAIVQQLAGATTGKVLVRVG
jgi:NADPH-dependent curcumin reductase CurA